MSVTVRYVDAPHESPDPSSLINLLIEAATHQPVEVVTDTKATVDLEMVSVHATELSRLSRTLTSVAPGKGYRGRLRQRERWNAVYREPTGRSRRSVWFTGDNIRPPGGPWDGYLSFDLDPLEGRNAYFPHWFEYVGLLGSHRMSYSGLDLTVVGLMTSRAERPRPTGFACTFIGNPTPTRLHAIDALSKVGKVEVFGNSVGRGVPSKVEVAKDFRYVMCFENDLYPGYVTEKPFEAWATGAVPLWWGSDPAGYVNPAAIMNAADYDSLADFASAVADLDRESGGWEERSSRPILLRAPDIDPAVGLLRRLLVG
jgi:hypothetical protein